MANIKLNELSALNLDGSDLFDGSESFLVDVNESLDEIVGGYYGYGGINCGVLSQVNCDKNSVNINCGYYGTF